MPAPGRHAKLAVAQTLLVRIDGFAGLLRKIVTIVLNVVPLANCVFVSRSDLLESCPCCAAVWLLA